MVRGHPHRVAAGQGLTQHESTRPRSQPTHGGESDDRAERNAVGAHRAIVYGTGFGWRNPAAVM